MADFILLTINFDSLGGLLIALIRVSELWTLACKLHAIPLYTLAVVSPLLYIVYYTLGAPVNPHDTAARSVRAGPALLDPRSYTGAHVVRP